MKRAIASGEKEHKNNNKMRTGGREWKVPPPYCPKILTGTFAASPKKKKSNTLFFKVLKLNDHQNSII